jgi:5'-3' exonuclease
MIGLIDADFIPYFVCYNKQDEPEKTLDEAISSANSYLQGLLNGTSVEEFNLFFTVGKNFRYEIYPEYKANRIGKEKPPFFDEVKTYLINEYKGIHGYNLEADDLLVIYKNKYIEDRVSYVVISTDKDITNLFGVNYDIKNNVINAVTQDYADRYFWKSMICGDTADNIKGLPGKGPVFADKLFLNIDDVESYRNLVLNEYITKFGEENGINEFYVNYKCLKIKDSYEGIEFLEPIKSTEVYARTLNVVRE